MAKKVAYPGLEELQAAVERKRAMSKALLEQGMARERMTSPLQVLGKWAEVWAGKSTGRDADNAQSELAKAVMNKRLEAVNQYNGLPQNVTPEQRMSYALTQQYLPDEFKKLATDMATPDIKEVNGTFVNMKQAKPGSYAPNDPSADVLRGADGSLNVNLPKLQQHLAQATGRTAPIAISPQQDPMMATPQAAPALPPGYDPAEWAVDTTTPPPPQAQAPQGVNNSPEAEQMHQQYLQTFGPRGEQMFQEWLHNTKGGR